MTKKIRLVEQKGPPPMVGLFGLAVETGFCVDTVRKYVKNGKIASVKIGGRYRVSRAEVDRILREGL